MTRPRTVAVARLVLGVAVLAAVVVALADRWHAVAPVLRTLSVTAAAEALVLLVAGLLATLVGWRAVLADLGSPLPARKAGGVFFVGQLGKYLPGSVWPVVAQAEMAKRLGVPRTRSALTGLVAIGVSVVTGLALGSLALPTLLGQHGHRRLGVLLLVLALLGAPAALHPPVLNRLVGWGLLVVRRPPLEQPLTRRGVATAAAAMAASWVLLGLHLWVLAGSAGAPRAASLVPAAAAFALATSLGLVVVVAPAGAGVREVVLVLVLTRWLTSGAATAVAVESRFLFTVADVALALSAAAAARSARPGRT